MVASIIVTVLLQSVPVAPAAVYAQINTRAGRAVVVVHGSEQKASQEGADIDEIVITADRYGEANVAAESEFEEGEIASYGTGSIQDLLSRLSPLIDPSGEEPVLLINGKPTGLDSSILSYPAEALQRLVLLKPEAAVQYGEPAGKRVVNLVLKRQFSTWNADGGFDFATAGGQYGGKLSVNRTAISGSARWSARVQVGEDSAFLKASRTLPVREGVFDSVGFVSAPDGGAVDVALSEAVGRPVVIAAIPEISRTRPPLLADFVSTADLSHSVDPNHFETLQSSRRNISMGIGVTRPIGNFTVSLNLGANNSSSTGLRGLPMASVLISAENPYSPFSSEVLLVRPLDGDRALRIENASTSINGALTISGNINDWQTNFSISYSRNWAHGYLENEVDVFRVQKMIDDNSSDFNPFGVWGADLLVAARNRSKTDNLSLRLNVKKSIINMPAGSLTWMVAGTISRNNSHSRQYNAQGYLSMDRDAQREQSSGQMSLSVPFSRMGEAGSEFFGDLTLDISASLQMMSNSRPQKRYGANMTWAPLKAVQFRGSVDFAESQPSFDQLDAPILTSVNRVFDYARGEVVEPIWMTGGNPNLHRGSAHSLSLDALVRPFGDQLLSLNLGFRRSVNKHGISGFPELAPVIERTFPERVIRDDDGRLVSVDARAINIDHSTESDLNTGVSLRLPRKINDKTLDRRKIGGSYNDPLQFSFSFNHRWRLKSHLLMRVGVPVINELRDTGQSRHNLFAQMTIGKPGVGASISGNWSNASRLKRDVSKDGSFFVFTPPITINASMFVEPDRLFPSFKGKILDGLKLSLEVQNLFNGYRRVTMGDGHTPVGYSRYEIDPLGRQIRMAVRKIF